VIEIVIELLERAVLALKNSDWIKSKKNQSQIPENVYKNYGVPAQETAKHRAKFG